MAAKVTQVVVEGIIPRTTYSPTTPTGAGVTKVVAEVVTGGTITEARVSQVVVEAIMGGNPDGSHGDPGGGSSGSPVTTTFGYAV